MNFLGHLFFSGNDTKLMQNNLFGDFVKGSDLSGYPEMVQEGILLHRRIDDFIDNHPVVRDLMHVLYEPLPRIAGVAIDLYFDHLLANYWEKYHVLPLEAFAQRFYDHIRFDKTVYTPEFLYMLQKMSEYNWLVGYRSIEGLDRACRGVSARLTFDNELKNAAAILPDFRNQVDTAFETYMNDALREFPH